MATDLTPDQMKQFVRDHFEEFVNRRNAAVIHKNMTPDFYDHDGPGGKPTGVDGDERMMIAMYQYMPDLRLTIEDMIAEVTRWCAVTSGAGPIQRRARRCSFMASCCGASRETRSPSAGPRSCRLLRELRGVRAKSTSQRRNRRRLADHSGCTHDDEVFGLYPEGVS